MGVAVFPPCFLTWGQTMVEVVKIMKISFKRSNAALMHSVPPTLQQATANPHLHWRLLDTHGWVWVSLLWGHCSFLLGLGVRKVLFVPSKSLFLQSCVSSGGSVVGLMTISSKRAYAAPRSTVPRARALEAVHSLSVPPQKTLKQSFGCLFGVSGSWCTQVLFEPSVHLWRVWDVIINVISPLLPSYWGFSFSLGCGVSFFGGIQHYAVDGCSGMSGNFEVLAGDDECMSFYSTIL